MRLSIKRKHHKTDKEVRLLRNAEELEWQVWTIGQVYSQLDIGKRTLHQWRT